MNDLTTRPALRTRRLAPEFAALKLRLTIIFHPDLSRIGAWVDVASWRPDGSGLLSRPLRLGRSFPIFNDGEALNEAHVSRTTCELSYGAPRGPSTLHIRSLCGDGCRIGVDESAQLVASEQDLQWGIALRLGHGVVCYLRLIESRPSDDMTQSESSSLPMAFMGASIESHRLRQQLKALAVSELPVLILGESGVGKEVAAKAIHEGSRRWKGSLIAVNMAGVNESLAAAQMFGSARGAFTGAEKRGGYFQQARDGTLFLDEIGDCAPGVQTLLLRALELGEVQVVGGKVEKVDVRFIAATDGDVSKESGFSHALYNRLSGHTLVIPPLRQRLEDVGPQLLHFLLEAQRTMEPTPVAGAIGASAHDPEVAARWGRFFFDALHKDWPGNTRELRNAALREAESGDESLAERFAVAEPPAVFTLNEDTLEQLMAEHAYEVQAVAKRLGIPRSTLRRKVQAHPQLRLIEDLDDETILTALARERSLQKVALHLKVSERALKGWLNRMDVK